jgi:hypothetical protein
MKNLEAKDFCLKEENEQELGVPSSVGERSSLKVFKSFCVEKMVS